MMNAAKSVSYEVIASADGCVLHRNGAPLKTPAGVAYAFSAVPLAEAIAEEWRKQGDKPKPMTMPLTQLASTAIDITSKQQAAIIEQVVGYASSDLLCQRARHPEELVRRQQEIWQPILDWCGEKYDAPLLLGQGVMPVVQPPKSLQALRRPVENCDAFMLTGLKQASETCHSLVLGLALMNGYITFEKVFAAAECDSLYQMEKWGEDPTILERHNSVRSDLAICEKWFRLLAAN